MNGLLSSPTKRSKSDNIARALKRRGDDDHSVETRALRADDPEYPVAMSLLGLVEGGQSATLYLRGRLPTQTGVAVVGTRRASESALAFTDTLVRDLARAQISIWSGGARGIDRCAHEAALAVGLPTVVVTAGGLDDPYPPEHADLYQGVLDTGGGLLSLQADGARRLPAHFIQRNGVLAALSAVTVLIEAPKKSGARSTAAAARRLGRPLLVVPAAPWSTVGEGCALELARGARGFTKASDVLTALRHGDAQSRFPAIARPPRAPPSAPPTQLRGAHASASGAQASHAPKREAAKPVKLTPDEQRVFELLSDESQHIDTLCAQSALPYPLLSGTLLSLTLSGMVVEQPLGHFRKA